MNILEIVDNTYKYVQDAYINFTENLSIKETFNEIIKENMESVKNIINLQNVKNYKNENNKNNSEVSKEVEFSIITRIEGEDL